MSETPILMIKFVDNAKKYMQCSLALLRVTMVGIEMQLPKPYYRHFTNFQNVRMYDGKEAKGHPKNSYFHSVEENFEDFHDDYGVELRRAEEERRVGLCYAVEIMPKYDSSGCLDWGVLFYIQLPFNDETMELEFIIYNNYWDDDYRESENLLNHVARLNAEKAECLARIEQVSGDQDDDDDSDTNQVVKMLYLHAKQVTEEKEKLIGTGISRSVESEQEVSMVNVILRYYELIKRMVDHIGRGDHHLKILHNTDLFTQMERYNVYEYHPSEKQSIPCPQLETYLCECAYDPEWFADLQKSGKYPHMCAVARVAQSNSELWEFLRSASEPPDIIPFRLRMLPFIAGMMTMFVPIWTAISNIPSNNVQAHVYSRQLYLRIEYVREDSEPKVNFVDSGTKLTRKEFGTYIESRLQPFAPAANPTNYVRRDIFPVSLPPFTIEGEKHGVSHLFLVVHEQTPTEEVLYMVDNLTDSWYEKYPRGPYTVDARVVLRAIKCLFLKAFPKSRMKKRRLNIQPPMYVPEVAEGEPACTYDCSFIALSNIARLHVYPAFRDISKYDIEDSATKNDIAVFWSYIRYHMTVLYQDVVLNKQGYLMDSNIPGELVENGFFWEIDMKGQRVRKLQFIDYEMIDITDVREPREHRRCCTVQANMDFRPRTRIH